MIINDYNGEIICTKKVNIHDDIIENMKYDCINSKLVLSVISDCTEAHEYMIIFNNVVGFELTSCDYWGDSPHVLDFEYISHKDRILLPKLINYMRDYPDNPRCKLKLNKEYIETVITFTSGDKLNVLCEYIDYKKRK